MPLNTLRLIGRLFLLAVLIAGVVVAWLDRDALAPATIEAALTRSAAAPFLFLAAHIATSLLFIPRALIAATAGLIFGLWWGLVWATIGSMLGSACGFLLARYIYSGLVDLETLPWFGPYLRRAERGGWPVVTVIRLLPINHSFVNYALALTKIRLADYLIGSLLGQIPSTVAFVEFGAVGERAASGKSGWLVPMALGLAALAAGYALRYFFRKRDKLT
jgi:uncharacterized membrane protein YdjX (TVP38/TMEM64 family)